LDNISENQRSRLRFVTIGQTLQLLHNRITQTQILHQPGFGLQHTRCPPRWHLRSDRIVLLSPQIQISVLLNVVGKQDTELSTFNPGRLGLILDITHLEIGQQILVLRKLHLHHSVTGQRHQKLKPQSLKLLSGEVVTYHLSIK
jgi:hypothetical protein